ncbi:uncharacterized protein DUF58 [Marinomonas aquiplantarum]|uniref:Uncharacterized protein DUF58 n=2 Tax=Marinomonas aquiplantarum TaxID=491951 RepID=A0A366D152_9GAMM|nr:uncharacterized protein DUF58 [Marinomonas aquiplantarum]
MTMSALLAPSSPELQEVDFAQLGHYAKHLGRAPRAHHFALTSGERHAHLKGQGLEMLELRAYQASDDLRHIDWRVTARTGQAQTRLYAQENEHQRLLLMDLSSEAYFGTKHSFISTRFVQLAGIIAWRTKQQGDKLSYRLCFGGQDIWQQTTPLLPKLFHPLSQASLIQSRHHATPALQILTPNPVSLKARNKDVIILTDKQQLGRPETLYLKQLAQHNKVFWVQIIDVNTFKLVPGQYQIKSVSGESIVHVSKHSSNLAQQAFQKQNQQLKKQLNQLDIEHLVFDLSEPPEGIARYLLSLGAIG